VQVRLPTTWKSSDSFSHQKSRLACLFVVVIETACRQTGIVQSNQVALAIRGCVNDALRNCFVNDRRWFGVKLAASIVKCLAYKVGDAIVKNDPGLSDKRQNGRPVGDFLQETSKVYVVAVDGSRQVLVEFRHDFDARVNIVEQHANLLCRKGSAALGNRVPLKTNNAIQAGQVVRYPMIGLSQTDTVMFN
jgi:hypothetical protein